MMNRMEFEDTYSESRKLVGSPQARNPTTKDPVSTCHIASVVCSAAVFALFLALSTSGAVPSTTDLLVQPIPGIKVSAPSTQTTRPSSRVTYAYMRGLGGTVAALPGQVRRSMAPRDTQAQAAPVQDSTGLRIPRDHGSDGRQLSGADRPQANDLHLGVAVATIGSVLMAVVALIYRKRTEPAPLGSIVTPKVAMATVTGEEVPEEEKVAPGADTIEAVVEITVDATDATKDAENPLMSELKEFLIQDLPHLFDDQGINTSKYDKDMTFEDPLSRFGNLEWYMRNIQALKVVFRPDFKLYTCEQTGPDEITTRWTMTMKAPLPWQPELIFTGRSYYTVSQEKKLFTRHVDVWDSIDNNAYLSPEAVQDLVRQIFQFYSTPDLKGPKYEVLRRTANYEIRRYKPYTVAETRMGGSADVASGSGFNELAGYIFGGNEKKEKMNMTTPVFTTSGPVSDEPVMQFVMEEPTSKLPKPDNSKVSVKQVEGQLVAAAKFSGVAMDWDVKRMEKELRKNLFFDRIPAEEGYTCARYNDPAAAPWVRRNEVLIRIEDDYNPLA